MVHPVAAIFDRIVVERQLVGEIEVDPTEQPDH